MAINIKELFSADSDNVRLDKVNYNFDQIVANGGGPTGATGAKGSVGPQGSKGQKGEIGDTGVKGEPGTATDYFFRNSTRRNFTLVPKWDNGGSEEAASLVLGEKPADDSSVTVDEQAPLVLVKDTAASNPFEFLFKLRTEDLTEFITGDVEILGSDIIFKLNKSAIGALNAKYLFGGKRITLNNGTTDKVILDENDSIFNSNVELNGNAQVDGPAVFNSTVRIPASAGANKVLTSDASGYASWQVPSSDVPIGTIVMVAKFVLDSSVNWTGAGGLLPATDYIGRGTGSWAGWYYCWGQTWGSYETPDLRERYPVGFAGAVNGLLSGASDEAKYAAVGAAGHSTSGLGGYFGTNDIDQLQAKQTASAHTHNVTVTPDPRTEPDVIGVDATYAANTPVTTTSTSNGAFTTDITPRSAVLGFMIYLGSSTLTYSNLAPVGPQGPITS